MEDGYLPYGDTPEGYNLHNANYYSAQDWTRIRQSFGTGRIAGLRVATVSNDGGPHVRTDPVKVMAYVIVLGSVFTVLSVIIGIIVMI